MELTATAESYTLSHRQRESLHLTGAFKTSALTLFPSNTLPPTNLRLLQQDHRNRQQATLPSGFHVCNHLSMLLTFPPFVLNLPTAHSPMQESFCLIRKGQKLTEFYALRIFWQRHGKGSVRTHIPTSV